MFNVKVPEQMVLEEPKNLSALQAFAWDEFFNNGWYIFKIANANNKYMAFDESINWELAYFFNSEEELKAWLQKCGEDLLFDCDE